MTIYDERYPDHKRNLLLEVGEESGVVGMEG